MTLSRQVSIKRVNLAELRPEDRRSINQILEQSTNATVFHTVEWNELLSKEFGLRDVTLLATVASKPAGLCCFYEGPGHLLRSSAIHLESAYGGPITTGDPRVVVELLKEAEKSRGVARFEIWTPANYDIAPLLGVGYSSREMYTSILDLCKSEDELWKGIHRKRRASIRKATDSQLSVVPGDAALVDDYYEMVVSTFTRAQIDALPKTFYGRVVGELGPKGMAKFLLASYDGHLIAGVIVLPYKDTLYGWHMASHKEYWHLAPNDFLQWELIKWAKQEGYRYYDLLRVEPDHLPGIAHWKTSFGGDTVPCYYVRKATLAYKLLQRLSLLSNPRTAIRRGWALLAGRADAH